MAFSSKIYEEYMNKMKSHFSLAYRNENSFRGPSDTTKQLISPEIKIPCKYCLTYLYFNDFPINDDTLCSEINTYRCF